MIEDHRERPNADDRACERAEPAEVALTVGGANAFDATVAEVAGGSLRGATIGTVQVNVGLRCNLACRHCHVESSPSRTEEMDWPTMELVLDAVRTSGARTLDITGGAPEMNPHFRRLVTAAREGGVEVMVRTNLTILLEPGFDDLPEFMADMGVHLIASLPCYLERNVDRQRGLRVFDGSIRALRRLNEVGYGHRVDLPIDLVFNPTGPSLPPPQEDLERDYRKVLLESYGIRFSRLIAITNLPIGRFEHDLRREGRLDGYRRLLRDSFNPATLDGLMCRHQLHVDWDGRLHDCDFNLALSLRAVPEAGTHIRDFDPSRWTTRRIATGEHCFGCTAGCGSSCGGALVTPKARSQSA